MPGGGDLYRTPMLLCSFSVCEEDETHLEIIKKRFSDDGSRKIAHNDMPALDFKVLNMCVQVHDTNEPPKCFARAWNRNNVWQ